MRVWVVTGCLGFLGRALTKYLLDGGDCVYGIDAETYAARPIVWGTEGWFPTDRFKYVKADIAALDWLPDADIVVNCAAETHVDNSIGDASKFLHSNILGTHRLLELVRAKRNYRMPLLVQVSTDEVYGPVPEGTVEPWERTAPANPYAASKAAADALVQAWGWTHGVPYRILRMTNLYGPGQYPEKLIPKAVRYLSHGKRVPIHGKGEASRSWLHLPDACRAVWHVATQGRDSTIYHAGGNTEATVWAVVSRLVDLVRPGENPVTWVETGLERPGLDERYALDDQVLRHLGWRPTGDLWRDLPAIVAMEQATIRW